MDDGNMDLWSTHLPVLVACVAKTDGPVLELGCGHYSTRVLHAMCDGRRLVTCDTNRTWVEAFAHLRSKTHEIVCAPDASAYAGERWDVVFVDEAPAGHRIGEIIRLRPVTWLFVVNNTEPAITPGRRAYRYVEILPMFPYRFDYKRYPVWTSVVSDVPLPDWIERLV